MAVVLCFEAYDDANFGEMTMDMGNVYTNMGLTYRRMGDLDMSEKMYLKFVNPA
jgi:hypothetical protein